MNTIIMRKAEQVQIEIEARRIAEAQAKAWAEYCRRIQVLRDKTIDIFAVYEDREDIFEIAESRTLFHNLAAASDQTAYNKLLADVTYAPMHVASYKAAVKGLTGREPSNKEIPLRVFEEAHGVDTFDAGSNYALAERIADRQAA